MHKIAKVLSSQDHSMMEKRLFNQKDGISVFSGHGFEKKSLHKGSMDVKTEEADISDLPDNMQEFLRTEFRPDTKNFCYLAINALSDEETYGDNVNGDAMPGRTVHGDPCLANETSMHGYKTYELFGHWYKNHDNKKPKKAQGFVLFSSYDVEKGIVIILAGIDRSKRPDLVARIDAGHMPLTSMGIKVPFDLCSKCSAEHGTREFIEDATHEWFTDKSLQEKFENPGKFILWHNDMHKKKHGTNMKGLSRTTKEYCDHLKFSMGKMMNDGTKIYAVNHFPKAFDISDVYSNGDKVSQGLLKVAGGRLGDTMFNDSVHEGHANIKSDNFGYDQSRSLFLSNGFLNADDETVKSAEMEKEIDTKDKPEKINEKDLDQIARRSISEIIKNNGGAMASMDLESKSHPLPEEFMSKSDNRPMNGSINALRESRIMPEPSEFQEIMLRSMGMKDEAMKLKSKGVDFTDAGFSNSQIADAGNKVPESAISDIFTKKASSDEIMDSLQPVFAERTFLQPFYFGRLKREMSKLGSSNSGMNINKAGGFTPKLSSGLTGPEDIGKDEITPENFLDGFDVNNKAGLLEVMALSAFIYPKLRNSIAKSFGGKMLPRLSSNQAALVAASAMAGDGLISMLEPEMPKIDAIERNAEDISFNKEAGLLDYAPWSANKLKAHMGALATMPVIHGYSLHQRKRAMRGERLNDMDRWIALNPDVLSLGYLAAGPGVARAAKGKALNMFKKANIEMRSFNNSKKNIGNIVSGTSDSSVKQSDVKPVGSNYGWKDRLMGGMTWGLMSPGNFIPSFAAGLLDTELLHKLLD